MSAAGTYARGVGIVRGLGSPSQTCVVHSLRRSCGKLVRSQFCTGSRHGSMASAVIPKAAGGPLITERILASVKLRVYRNSDQNSLTQSIETFTHLRDLGRCRVLILIDIRGH